MSKTLFYMTFSSAFNGTKEDKIMEALTWIFTLCGAATLAHGLMAIIEVLDRE